MMEFEVIEQEDWDSLFDTWGEFGKWKRSRTNGFKPHHRRLRIGIRSASNLEGQVIFCYLDQKNPRSCAVVRFPLIQLERMIKKYKKS